MSSQRLAGSESLFLRQRADDPVDWFPWGDEAFAHAAATDRPVFLSIGYAACRWSSQMQRESFCDPDIAARLRTDFVPVLVDRDLRPDVDALYLESLLEMQGEAGWPASLFLLADRRPFTGATYLPPTARFGLPSFGEVLERVAEMWRDDRQVLVGAADQLRKQLFVPPPRAAAPDAAGYAAAVAALTEIHDEVYGGFGDGQKFPHVPELELALLGAVDGLPGADDAVRASLLAMDHGALQDHLGGGFHRSCLERTWDRPQFEKPLAENAQLLRLYARASSYLTRHGREAADEVVGAIRVARDTAAYLLGDLAHPGGGFCAAEAAEDPNGDGWFYTFTHAEAQKILGAGAVPYGLRPDAPADQRQVLTTRSGVPAATVRARLLSWRDRRARPARDTQRVVAWNALAASALAEAGRLFAEARWVGAAAETVALLREHAADRRAIGASEPATLEDLTHLAEACLAVHQAQPHDHRWLQAARDLATEALARFADGDGACAPPPDRGDLFLRRTAFTDGAEPNGNARLAEVLRQLELLGLDVGARLDALLDAASGTLRDAPTATPGLWSVVRGRTAPPRQGPVALILAGDPEDRRTRLLLRVWNRSWRPQGVVAIAHTAADREAIPLARDKHPGPDGTPLAYVCRAGRCDFPVASVDDLGKILG